MTDHATAAQPTTQSDEATGSVYRMERRAAERHDAAGGVTALRFMQASRPCTTVGLRVRNMSSTGVAAVSADRFEVGEVVALYFGLHGCEGPVERVGRIVRCRPAAEIAEHSIARIGDGYDVAIHFDAAA